MLNCLTVKIVGIGVVIVDSQRGWTSMYILVYSDVVNDSYVARKTFDTVIRKASRERYYISDTADWIEVNYYSDEKVDEVDRYARFYVTGSQLNIEYGYLDPKVTTSVQTICDNVSACSFLVAGRSAQMILTLDNGSQTVNTVTSSVMHNE